MKVQLSMDEALQRLEHLKSSFAEIIAETAQGGASLSLWQGGTCLLSLKGGEASPGRPWTSRTHCLILSLIHI